MNRYLLVWLSTLVLLVTGIPLYAAEADTDTVIVTMIEGTAQVYPPGSASGTPVEKSARISRDSEIRVAEKSRVELRFPDGSVMRLAEKSQLKLSEVKFNKKSGAKQVGVNLSVGRLWAKIKKLATADSKVEVKTVNAVAGVRGTVYRVNVESDSSAMVRVYDGSVYVAGVPREVPKPAAQVSGPVPVPGPHEVPPPYHEVTMEQWLEIVKSFQQITISAQGVASKPQDFNVKEDAADEWVRWNQERDGQLTF